MNKKGFFALLGVLAALVIIFILCYIVYSKKTPFINKSTQKVLTEEGIDTSNYQATIDSTKKKIEEINKQYEEQLNNLDKQSE
jgi:peptidoglycan hydrolase CwlO-like protein